jgi:hypothetical protein
VSDQQKFRVGVVTVWEVNAVNWRDAVNIAEAGARRVIVEVSEPTDEKWPISTVKWQHPDGREYEARLVRWPREVSGALRDGYMFLEVHQPAE